MSVGIARSDASRCKEQYLTLANAARAGLYRDSQGFFFIWGQPAESSIVLVAVTHHSSRVLSHLSVLQAQPIG